MTAVASARAGARSVARKRMSGTVPVQPRVGAVQVTEVQRARMLAATVAVVGELGYEKMSVARVTARAGVSRRTFYDMFEDREECFLAAFNETVERARTLVRDADADGGDWRVRVRGGLAVLLGFFADEPLTGRVLVVDALKAGPAVLERRAGVVQELIDVVEGGRAHVRRSRQVAPLAGEGVVGAVLGVLHARLSPGSRESLTVAELLNPLMATIVLPYLGVAAAERELTRPLPTLPHQRHRPVGDPLEGLSMRFTYRTLRVLAAIAGTPGASNRMVGEWAGISDQGQISKLLARLEGLGLIRNTGVGHVKGEPNAWSLTGRGSEVEQAVRGEHAAIENHEEGAVQ